MALGINIFIINIINIITGIIVGQVEVIFKFSRIDVGAMNGAFINRLVILQNASVI